MMKTKYTLLLLLSLFLFGIVACSDDDDMEESGFRVIETLIKQGPEKVEGTIELSSDDFDFTVKDEWCEVVKDQNILKINAGPNYEITNRTTEILIHSGSKKFSIAVVQIGTTFEFLDQKDLEAIDFNLSTKGGKRYVSIMSNIEYEVVLNDDVKNWIKVNDLGDGNHELVIAKSEGKREGVVVFKHLDKELVVTVEQKDFMSFDDFLNAKFSQITYTTTGKELGFDEEGNVVIKDVEKRVTRDVKFESKKVEEEFYLVVTLDSGKERKIPLQYHGDKEGEIRFSSIVIEPNFTDPANDERIGRLATLIRVDELNAPGYDEITQTVVFPASKTGGYSQQYYPAKFSYVSEESDDILYKFEHSSESIPNTITKQKTTRGIEIWGMHSTVNIRYGKAYDRLLDIELVIRK